ncbi:Cerato-platanin [Zopfochytrium polystomum]|nr:Cerato-platanin [Zopfochytrium polystomum]
MQFSAILASLALLVSTATASPLARRDQVSVAYNDYYNRNSTLPLTAVACSNGVNGLLKKGYTDIRSLPGYASAAPYLGSWNSPKCGQCYKVSYSDKFVYVIAVDVADSFVMGQYAMNVLTGGQAYDLGRVPATAVEAPQSACNF